MPVSLGVQDGEAQLHCSAQPSPHIPAARSKVGIPQCCVQHVCATGLIQVLAPEHGACTMRKGPRNARCVWQHRAC